MIDECYNFNFELLSFLEIKWIFIIERKTSFILRCRSLLSLFYAKGFCFSCTYVLKFIFWFLDSKLAVELLKVVIFIRGSLKKDILIFKAFVLYFLLGIDTSDCHAFIIFTDISFDGIYPKRFRFFIHVNICKFIFEEFSLNS